MGLVTYIFSIGQGSNAWDRSIWSNKVPQCYVLTFGYEISNYFTPPFSGNENLCWTSCLIRTCVKYFLWKHIQGTESVCLCGCCVRVAVHWQADLIPDALYTTLRESGPWSGVLCLDGRNHRACETLVTCSIGYSAGWGKQFLTCILLTGLVF